MYEYIQYTVFTVCTPCEGLSGVQNMKTNFYDFNHYKQSSDLKHSSDNNKTTRDRIYQLTNKSQKYVEKHQ